MVNSYRNLFGMVPMEEPPKSIEERVLIRIERMQSFRMRIRVLGHAILAIGGAVALVPSYSFLSEQYSMSGLPQYVPLIVSDGTYVFKHSADFFMSIISALPASGLILVLGALLIFIYSIRRVLQYTAYSIQHRQAGAIA